MLTPQVLEAASFAARAHRGHVRKDGETPYVSHVFRVCLIVRDVFGFDDPRMLITALLHDTVEDTTTDCDDIAERYGDEIARWVGLLSKDKRLPEKEREEAYIGRLKSAPWQVHVCKLADMYDNVIDLPQLPATRRAKSVDRLEHYLAGLKSVAGRETATPLGIVEKLIAETRAALK